MLASVPATHIYHYILNKLYHRGQGGYDIGGGSPFEGIFCLGEFHLIGNISIF